MKKLKLIIFTALALAVSPLSGDIFIYDIVTPDAALSSYGPTLFGTASVNLLSPGSAQITYTAADGYLLGGSLITDWFISSPVDATAFAGGSQLPGFSSAFITTQGGFVIPVSSFGPFFTANSSSLDFQNAYKSITIIVGDFSPLWASAADVLDVNSLGNSVAAHIFVCASADCSVSAGPLADGWATNGVVAVPVPEPSTYLILGSVLAMVLLFKRNVKANKANIV